MILYLNKIVTKMIDKIKAFFTFSSPLSIVQNYKVYENQIFSLSMSEAKNLASDLLSDSTKFLCVVNEIMPSQLSEKLSTSLLEFFSKYESVEWSEGSAYLNRNEVRPYEWNKGFLFIGEDSDGTAIITKILQDELFVIYGDSENEKVLEDGRYPSVYHWILMKDLDKFSEN